MMPKFTIFHERDDYIIGTYTRLGPYAQRALSGIVGLPEGYGSPFRTNWKEDISTCEISEGTRRGRWTAVPAKEGRQ